MKFQNAFGFRDNRLSFDGDYEVTLGPQELLSFFFIIIQRFLSLTSIMLFSISQIFLSSPSFSEERKLSFSDLMNLDLRKALWGAGETLFSVSCAMA